LESWGGGLFAFIGRNKLLVVLASSLVATEALVSVATWYGVAVLGGRELNWVYGYSTSIEVGRPMLALLFAILLAALLENPRQRLVGVSCLLGMSVADLMYDSVYIATGGELLGMATAALVACAIPTVFVIRAVGLSRAGTTA
jgi:hypothetical protein